MSVILPNSKIVTSPLGFGCAYLIGGLRKRANCRLVDIAFDLGYRHFDVAPRTVWELLRMSSAMRCATSETM